MENSISFKDMQEASVDDKLNDLIKALNKTDINSDNIKSLQSKFNKAIDNKLTESELIEEFKKVDDDHLSRLEKLDKIESILKNNYIDTKAVKSAAVKRFAEMIVPVILGFVMLTLGLAMIIMPAPPYFEMFTIFYFNVNDGFTLMDLISLIIILTGVFTIIKSYFKFAN
ncbi:MAG TPA: hypothetical protein VFM79_07150 [Pelobium sp.]|nr:hypothetical protein [Pelobium sp.]